MKALSLLVQKLLQRLIFFSKIGQKSRSRSRSQKIWYRKVLSQGIHLSNIKALSPFVKKLWSRLSLLWTDGQTDRVIPI